MPRESKTSKRRLEAIGKQNRALELRIAGASLPEIAREVGYAGAPGAFKAIDTAIARQQHQAAETVRKLELSRLDRMLLSLWPTIIDPKVPPAERVRVVDAIIRIMDRRAKYLGLDAPIKIDVAEQIRQAARDAGFTAAETDEAVREAMGIVRQAQAAG